jgi:hypothetical protein
MASTPIVFAACLGTILVYSCIGLALARWLRASWAPAASLAPVLGWTVVTALGLPLQSLCGFTRLTTGLLVAAAFAVGAWVSARGRREGDLAQRLPAWAFVLAALIAVIPMAALLPKAMDGGVIIGSTAFDHSKIAMVDEITRLGLPAGNPFFGPGAGRGTLSYYYLWHFGAAQLSILSGVSGWEADAAMTGFTAYASVLLMMGLALRLAQAPGREGSSDRKRARGAAAVVWVTLLSLTGSLRPLLSLMIGSAGLDRLLSSYRGLAGWMVQASWVPQHMMSACCVVLAVSILVDLSHEQRIGPALLLGAVAAAAFGSSAWVGGVTFVIGAAGVGGVLLAFSVKRPHRLAFLLLAAAAAIVAIVLAAPILQAELGTLAVKRGTGPIGLHPYEVVGAWAPAGVRRLIDLPAYWLLLLPIELPAIYPVGAAALILTLRRMLKDGRNVAHTLSLALLTLASLATAWLLISTIGNNDLGWRAILPAVLILTPFAAATLARWMQARAYGAAAIGLALFVASVPDHQIAQNLHGKPSDDAEDFAKAPALWSAVRRYAGPTDRVANNPLYLDDLTDWPVNPSWAMLANRASCFAGWETARAYVALPSARLNAINDQFVAVFDGRGAPNDVRQMAQDYGCRVVVLVPGDGAWAKDPFAASPDYRLAETQKDRWRIYVARQPVDPRL